MTGNRDSCICPACDTRFAGAGVEIPDHEYALERTGCYVECPKCKTLFQEPMPNGKVLASFYPADYHSMTHAGLLQHIRNDARIRRLMSIVPGPEAILDFGCGDGSFLVQAAARMSKRSLWGFEIAGQPSTEQLANRTVTIVRGDLRDLLKHLPPCALITMNHVIEHLPDPKEVISALAGRLVRGGVLEGQTPAADSLEHAIFGRKWSGFHSPRHTVVFSREGLRRFLERSGFCTPTITGTFNPAGIAVSLGSLRDSGAGRIRRSGWRWMALLGTATLAAPLDLLSGRPGIVDFVAAKCQA